MSAAQITRALGGLWHGRYGMVRCATHADRSPSLKVWNGAGGLRVHCFAGCDWRMVKDALKARSLLNHGAEIGLAQPPQTRGELAKAEFADRVWKASRPIAGTAAIIYLRSRGIICPLPPSLRFNAALKHPATGRIFPAMVAGVQHWPAREVRAVHVTLLAAEGRKAPVENPRYMLGPCKGGAIRLAAGARALLIAEGVETALSVFQATGLPTWSGLSASFLAHVILPPLPLASEIVIAADNDAPGFKAAHEAAERWARDGRQVRIALPPAGKDFNDTLTRSAAT